MGKRVAHSFEHYDRTTGSSVFAVPSGKPGFFVYFDPVDTLALEIQERWKNETEREHMIADATAAHDASARRQRRALSGPTPGVTPT